MPSTVLISTSSFATYSDRPLRLLESAGLEVRLNPHGRKLNGEETLQLLDGVEGLIAGTERLDRNVFERNRLLRVISRCGTGLDNVDLVAAAELGISVCNTTNAHVDAVAELTLAGVLDVLRRVSLADRAIREGQWLRPPGRLLRGKTVGLLGLGRVGRRLTELLAPFETEVLACDPAPDEAFARRHGVRFATLDEVIERADIVSLHLPYSAEVHHIIDRNRLGGMKSGAVLVNCARGGLVDEDALADALDAGQLSGAFIDTFEREPYVGFLSERPTAVLSPHVGSFAAESRIGMETEAVENLIACLQSRGIE